MSWWESLVQVRCADGEKGTGTLISPTEILTAAHVVSRNGQTFEPGELTLDLRFLSRVAVALGVSVLPAWAASGGASNDIALIKVEPEANLGVAPVFGVPALNGSAMLEGYGFEAQNDTEQRLSGNVSCSAGPGGQPLLFTHDFAPIPGMSGGPVCVGLPSGVHVAGILIRQSSSGLVGLSVTAAVLARLRQGF